MIQFCFYCLYLAGFSSLLILLYWSLKNLTKKPEKESTQMERDLAITRAYYKDKK